MSRRKKWVYLFEEGNRGMRDLLGGKGANLAEMYNLGLPVPPGFTITTDACNTYIKTGRFAGSMWEQIEDALGELEVTTGKVFGDPTNPLLVSCRSGAKVSMPGMMDTVLNIGLTVKTMVAVDNLVGEEASNVMRERLVLALCEASTVNRRDIDCAMAKETSLERYIRYDSLLRNQTAEWQNGKYHLQLAISQIFKSWAGVPAQSFRNAESIESVGGTACNVQAMVFGNTPGGGTGVVFTRNPSTGEKHLYGEYLPNAQGEDIVAGIKTPLDIEHLERYSPDTYEELLSICDRLEHHYRDMQDIEFTIERGKLWILQCRDGRRTSAAAIKIAADMAHEGIIGEDEVASRVPITKKSLRFSAGSLAQAIADGRLIASGLNASPGVAVGIAVFDADEAAVRGGDEAIILVRRLTKPEDVHGMVKARGIVTSIGGMTSHAAVVARSWGIPCVTAIEEVSGARVHGDDGDIGDHYVKGSVVSIDGYDGKVYLGEIETEEVE